MRSHVKTGRNKTRREGEGWRESEQERYLESSHVGTPVLCVLTAEPINDLLHLKNFDVGFLQLKES